LNERREKQMENKNYTKALKKINTLINKAKRERDSKGYRENLGYDSHLELEDYMSELNLPWQERTELKKIFYKQCDEI